MVFFYISQSKYWNPRVNEVEAVITDRAGQVIHKLFGKWNEALYSGEPPLATCVWKASTMGFFINAPIISLYSIVKGIFSLPSRYNASGL